MFLPSINSFFFCFGFFSLFLFQLYCQIATTTRSKALAVRSQGLITTHIKWKDKKNWAPQSENVYGCDLLRPHQSRQTSRNPRRRWTAKMFSTAIHKSLIQRSTSFRRLPPNSCPPSWTKESKERVGLADCNGCRSIRGNGDIYYIIF